ncbi:MULTISPECIES: class A beta-lactamase [Streptomyces]|uniref:Beta-lactamase n=1 Tax=Streptomyces venezuelae TaxID=54571 RepID=A0A5P2BMS0_STRVZ|nr:MULTISPECIES: class A beta-lactamase [Streptomyces]MYY85593.1 class A beta-lactamase [Streptomyces sp. SID335]MYZ17066.1 class A beta-lactamase [Streptomyces sp. SID337]NDZ85160.1 class A beta-lactamase [Streptomyces sp. SID10115]NEB48906.1 class A beta-lactamase [Streptomyces sp. SID339]QES29649.1 class A beta-lactamase [Streptomyces venezuelae]
MTSSASRRTVLGTAAAAPVLLSVPGTASATAPAASAAPATPSDAAHRLRALEESYPGRIGVHALHTGTGAVVAYRADERFAIASTFKVLAAAAILRRAREQEPGLLDVLIRYGRDDLVTYSPRTEMHLETGMTVRELCDATITYSDNSAANLLMRRIGGPAGVTEFARSLGDSRTRLDRWETDLNTNIPGDRRDTTTPAAMTANLRELVLGKALHPLDRGQLIRWLVENTTGDKRIRAGLPEGWRVGDKTGSPAYGGVNDVAVAWPPKQAPLVVSVYTTRLDPDTPGEDRIAEDITRIAVDALT